MEIRRLEDGDILAAKQLWMDAFGDSEAFVRFYFVNKYDQKRSLGAFDKDILAGDLTMQEMKVRMRGALLKTGFLAGCATREQYRHKGVMRSLLYAQMNQMNKEGYDVCHLHPFLHTFYRKFGWETVSFMRTVTAPPGIKKTTLLENDFKTEEFLYMYSLFMQDVDGCFERSYKEMETRIAEHKNDGGGILAHNGGYALYFVEKSLVEVIELVWTKEMPETFVEPLGSYGLPVRYMIPDFADTKKENKKEEYTMMRVVNAKRLLSKLHFSVGVTFTISVCDDFCEWNNQTFLVDCGERETKVDIYTGTAVDIQADIRDLARMAAGKTENYGKMIERIFTPQKTCFFNTY